MPQLTWLVTGCSSGFGEQFIKSILQRGDKAIATARKPESIEKLKAIGAATLLLDVTAIQAKLDETIKQAWEIHGRIDVIVQNAGFSMIGTLNDLG